MTINATYSPKVSIGLPVFNGENYLAESIKSLLSQTFGDFELIISDNASNDSTSDICHEFMRMDKRIRYFRNESNLGGAYNDNQVFSLSSGKYFKWAAHDDICASTLIEKCVNVLDCDATVVLCYPKTVIIDENGQFVENYKDYFHLVESTPHERFRQVLGQNKLLNPIYGIIRSESLRKTRLIKKYTASDRVLLGELALQGKFFEFPDFLFFRRIHPKKSTIANKTNEQLANWFDPKANEKIQIPKIRRFLDFLLSIHEADISLTEELACYKEFFSFYFAPTTLSGKFKGLTEDVRRASSVAVVNLIHHNRKRLQ